MSPLKAWPDREGFYSRDEVLARIEAHRKADEIIQGDGWDGQKGCAIGCAINEYNHEKVADSIRIPEELAQLIDKIHEGLPHADSLGWPGRIFGAIARDADTSDVCRQFKILVNRRNLALVTQEGKVFDEVRSAIRGVIAWLEDGALAAESAAEWSAESAVELASESAAWSAAWSAYQDQANDLASICQACPSA